MNSPFIPSDSVDEVTFNADVARRRADGLEQRRSFIDRADLQGEYIPELNTIKLTIPPEDMRRLATEYVVLAGRHHDHDSV